MAELLYQLNSYLKVFNATVVSVNKKEKAVELDRTAFYPGGGGQPHDVGKLYLDEKKSIEVKRVKQEGGHIWHYIEGDLPKKRSAVKGSIDWIRRHDLVRTHTALHVLCGVVWRDYGAQVT